MSEGDEHPDEEEELRYPPAHLPLGEEARPWRDLGRLARHPRREGQGGVPDGPSIVKRRKRK